jgi:hypothetical protein
MLRFCPTAQRIAAAFLVVAVCSGCSRSSETFVSERRAEAAGFRIEHFERDRLLFVHRPDGEKDGVDLGSLRRVFLHRIKARDSNDGKPKFWWQFDSGMRIVAAPFFGPEPRAILGILREELSSFDEASAMRMASVFEKDRASYCLVWASPEYLAETRTKSEDQCRP